MADIGTGATLTVGGTAWSVNITSLGFGGVTRPSIKTSHLGTQTADTFIVGDLYDAGTIEVGFQVDTEDPSTNVIPYAQSSGALTITYPIVTGDSTGATEVTAGFITNVSWDIPLEDLCTGTATFKLTGAIAPTNAS